MIAAVIPTLYHPPTLAPLLRVLKDDGVNVILIDTKDRKPAIYQWWNEGVAEAKKQGATEIAILNDDIIIVPETLLTLARALRDDLTLGVVYPETADEPAGPPESIRVQRTEGIWLGPAQKGMSGYAFMFRSDLGIPFDEAYHWYYGDNAFDEQVRAAGLGVACVLDLQISHLVNYSGSKRINDLRPLTVQDKQRWKQRTSPIEVALNKAYSAARSPVGKMTSHRIPAILHRVAIGPVPADSERFWAKFAALHPTWELRSHADPFDMKEWPLTSWAWPFVTHPAQQADLMRLEALWRDGGIYVDWDIEPYRPLDNLLSLECFAAWAELNKVANGVMGARPNHPAIAEALGVALQRFVQDRNHIMASGPDTVTDVFRKRSDVLLLSPDSFYSQPISKRGEKMPDFSDRPWAYGIHHMHASWAGPRAQSVGRVRLRRADWKLF